MQVDSTQRFWTKVDRLGVDECWEWLGPKDRAGYGMFSAPGSPRRAHRFAYELLIGPVPPGLQLDHLCRNRGCVNPTHLEPVTGAENVRRGDAAKLTEDDVRAIRSSSKRHIDLAEEYGVSPVTILHARTRETWADIQDDGIAPYPSNWQTSCKNGHPLSGDNLWLNKWGNLTARRCRICRRQYLRDWRAKKAKEREVLRGEG